MLIAKTDALLKKKFIRFISSNNLSILLLCIFYKYKLLNIILIFRFSRYFNVYLSVCNNMFFSSSVKVKSIILASNPFNTKEAVVYFRLLASSVTSKKKIIAAVALKKKANLFSKHNEYRKTVFYNMQDYVREIYHSNKKAVENSFNSNESNPQFSKKIMHTACDFDNRATFSKNIFFNTNYNFFKTMSRHLDETSSVTFLKKKTRLYRMNRGFNKRFYTNRLIFKNVFLKKNARQFTITKFVEQFKSHNVYNLYKEMQMFLFVVLISSHFFFFKADCLLFLKKHGVFINGKICTNPYKVLLVGDVVQLPILQNFFFYNYNYQASVSSFFKKYQSKFAKLFASRKQQYRTRSNYMPKWIEKMAFLSEDVPLFLEVDFSILTVMILYEPNALIDVHGAIGDHVLLYLHRTLNWRTLA